MERIAINLQPCMQFQPAVAWTPAQGHQPILHQAHACFPADVPISCFPFPCRSAYNTPWGASPLRYVGDGRPFWRFIVEQSTGCADERLFEELYQYYVRPGAWQLAPGAVAALSKLRSAGVRIAVVSNFDTRLRPILSSLQVDQLFDCVVVSAEVEAEKPNPIIFEAALQKLNLRPWEVVHVGDDRRNDVWGARDAGILSWLWGVDVHSFEEVARRVLKGPSAYAEDFSDEED
jgi:REG-2-like HAD superfamily hydrolase